LHRKPPQAKGVNPFRGLHQQTPRHRLWISPTLLSLQAETAAEKVLEESSEYTKALHAAAEATIAELTAATDKATKAVEESVIAAENRVKTARDAALARMQEITTFLPPI